MKKPRALLLSLAVCSCVSTIQAQPASRDLVKDLQEQVRDLRQTVDKLNPEQLQKQIDQLQMELNEKASKMSLKDVRAEANSTAQDMRILIFLGSGAAFVLSLVLSRMVNRLMDKLAPGTTPN